MTITPFDIEHPDRETSAEAAGRHLREAFGKPEERTEYEQKAIDALVEGVTIGHMPDQHEANMREADRLIQDAYFLLGKMVVQHAVLCWASASDLSESQRKSLAAALDAGMEAKP